MKNEHRILDRNSGRLSECYLLKIYKEISEGVMYIHMHNIIHCDLKLENILTNEW